MNHLYHDPLDSLDERWKKWFMHGTVYINLSYKTPLLLDEVAITTWHGTIGMEGVRS